MAQVYQAIKAYDPFHIVIGAPWATPWALFAFGESVGALSMDYAQVENYFPDPASHLGDARIRAGMYFEPIANSPPSYLLEGAGGMPAEGPHVAGGRLWEPAPAQLESTLSWMGAMSFGAVNVVNFVIEPARLKVVDKPDNITGTLPGGMELTAHINAQGDYGRFARKLLPALLPDLTDPVTGSRLRVAVSDASRCTSPPAVSGKNRPTVNFATQSSVVAMGVRQRWGAGGEKFCAFVVVCNLCGAPSSFKLVFESDEVPTSIVVAEHAFTDLYNTTVGTVGAQRVTGTDWVGGYRTSVLRLGCDGWTMLE